MKYGWLQNSKFFSCREWRGDLSFIVKFCLDTQKIDRFFFFFKELLLGYRKYRNSVQKQAIEILTVQAYSIFGRVSYPETIYFFRSEHIQKIPFNH